MNNNTKKRLYLYIRLIGLALICFSVTFIATIPLLNVKNVFAPDWINHLWTIEYFGQYIVQNNAIPVAINTQEIVGLPVPLFYSQKAYAIGGVFSALVGSAIAVRCMIILVFILQFVSVVRVEGVNIYKKIVVAIVVTWSIYPLTNLYNRSALTEFFAVVFLTSAIMSMFNLIHRLKNDKKPLIYDITAIPILFSLACISHPLTALFGGIFILLFLVITVCSIRKDARTYLMTYASSNVALIGLILSPWIYVLFEFNSYLPVSSPEVNKNSFTNGGFFPNSIDSFWSRISPLPVDLRVIDDSIINVPTPYLDAQIAFPLLLICVFSIVVKFIRIEKASSKIHFDIDFALIVGFVFIFILCMIVSVSPTSISYFGSIFYILQFPYRLVTYINLSLLVVVLLLFSSERLDMGVNSKSLINISCFVALAIAFNAVYVKNLHAFAVSAKVGPELKLPVLRPVEGPFEEPLTSRLLWKPEFGVSTEHLIHLPTTYYGYNQYMITKGFKNQPTDGFLAISYKPFKVNYNKNMGKTDQLDLLLSKRKLIITNVQPFPWTKIYVDGILLPADKMLVGLQFNKLGTLIDVSLAVDLPPGRHVLETKFEVPSLYNTLNKLSWVVTILSILCWLGVAVGSLYLSSRNYFIKVHDK